MTGFTAAQCVYANKLFFLSHIIFVHVCVSVHVKEYSQPLYLLFIFQVFVPEVFLFTVVERVAVPALCYIVITVNVQHQLDKKGICSLRPQSLFHLL